MSNWKNVNNWHWTGKNCLPWAKTYLGEQLSGLEASRNGITVKTDKLSDLEGDVDLNQRKGKIITIFDIKLNFQWSGSDTEGNEATGKISIPEFDHDTTEDDIVIEVSVDDSGDTSLAKIYEVARSELPRLIKSKIFKFSQDMIEAHGEDVHIPKEALGTPTPPRAASPMVGTNSSATSITNKTESTSSKPKVINTTTLEIEEEFQTSASELYEVFLDPNRVAVWTRAKPEITRTIGDKFSLFGGNITGSQVELVEGKKITQNWRLQSWPKDHHGTLSMGFEQGSGFTKLRTKLSGVPIGTEDITEQNLRQFYFIPIKRMGYVNKRHERSYSPFTIGIASTCLIVILAGVLIQSRYGTVL